MCQHSLGSLGHQETLALASLTDPLVPPHPQKLATHPHTRGHPCPPAAAGPGRAGPAWASLGFLESAA